MPPMKNSIDAVITTSYALGVTAVFVLLALEFALFALWRRHRRRTTPA